jgi:hypothetical protein
MSSALDLERDGCVALTLRIVTILYAAHMKALINYFSYF